MQQGRRLAGVGALWLGAVGCLMARPGVAAEFSADIVVDHSAPTALHVADQAVRIDAPTGYFLTKGGVALFVRPGKQMFTDARQSTSLTQWFIPVDPDSPCAQWRAAAMNAGVAGSDGEWLCEKIESAPRSRWRVTPPGQSSRECWIDPSLRFPVRIQMSDGTSLSLENIRPGAQSPELFTIPAGFHKLDPQSLIEHIKRSDVWVEPPPQ